MWSFYLLEKNQCDFNVNIQRKLCRISCLLSLKLFFGGCATHTHIHTLKHTALSISTEYFTGRGEPETAASTICCQIAESPAMAGGEIPRNSLSPSHHFTCHLMFCYRRANNQQIFLSKSPAHILCLSINQVLKFSVKPSTHSPGVFVNSSFHSPAARCITVWNSHTHDQILEKCREV